MSVPDAGDDDSSRPSESRPADLVSVGRVIEAYGVKGWVKLQPFNAPQESVLRSARRWWLDSGPLAIERSRIHGASIVAKPAGFDDRDAAQSLKGREIRVSRADFPPPSPGEVYWVDLVGCAVVNREDQDLGTVRAVEDYGAHPILLTRDSSGRDRMIPFVEAFLVEVDVPGRRIVADWQPDF